MRMWLAIQFFVLLAPVALVYVWDIWRLDVLIVGHVTRDVFKHGSSIGGAVTYAAAVASGLRSRACIVTTGVSSDYFSPHQAHVLESVNAPLTFEHTYRNTGFLWWSAYDRELRIETSSKPLSPIGAKHVPLRCLSSRTILLGPLISSDIDVASFTRPTHWLQHLVLPFQRIGVLAQGLQREVDPDGKISSRTDLSQALRIATTKQTTVFLSEVETDPWPNQALLDLTQRAKGIFVTRGGAGATLYSDGNDAQHVSAYEIEAVDTNGAGDTFATAYMLALRAKGADPGDEAARAAAVVCTLPQSCKPTCIPDAISRSDKRSLVQS